MRSGAERATASCTGTEATDGGGRISTGLTGGADVRSGAGGEVVGLMGEMVGLMGEVVGLVAALAVTAVPEPGDAVGG